MSIAKAWGRVRFLAALWHELGDSQARPLERPSSGLPQKLSPFRRRIGPLEN